MLANYLPSRSNENRRFEKEHGLLLEHIGG